MATVKATATRPPIPVFDFAGVLFHWQPLALLQALLPQHAVDAASTAHWAAQIYQDWGGDWAEFDRGTLDVDALVACIHRRSGLPLHLARAVVNAVPQALQPHPATVALVEQLHASGRPLFFLSNMPAPYADHLERHHGVLRLFNDGVFSARVQQVKPERAIFDLAAQRFAQPAAELLFFDDVPANVAAARAAGWQALLYTSAEQARADLLAAGVPLGPG